MKKTSYEFCKCVRFSLTIFFSRCDYVDRRIDVISSPLPQFPPHHPAHHHSPECREVTRCSASPSFFATASWVSCNCRSFSANIFWSSLSFSLVRACIKSQPYFTMSIKSPNKKLNYIKVISSFFTFAIFRSKILHSFYSFSKNQYIC